MSRRRLHGTTQKRRRKHQTRALKRSGSAARVEATQVPAGFERSPALERDDVVFLEAMRELEVRRSPHSGEATARRRAIARQYFEDDQTQRRTFADAMDDLGVQPLGAHPPATRRPATPPALPLPSSAAAEEPAPAAPATTAEEPAPAAPRRAPAGVEFAEDAADAALLAEALAGDAFDPARKYEGAPPPRAPHVRRAELERPDAELDLHGRTQEEAIRAVQNFLLTAHRQALREVLLITGRGLNSGNAGPVLHQAVWSWLERNGRPYAAEFRRAPVRLGGGGAIWVRLRAPRPATPAAP